MWFQNVERNYELKFFYFLVSRNESDETLTVVESTHPENVTFNHLAPYAKYMYTNECNKKMRSLKTHEKVSFLSNGHLFLEDDKKVRIYDRGFCGPSNIF